MVLSLKSLLVVGLTILSTPSAASPASRRTTSDMSRRDSRKGRQRTPKYFHEPGGSLELGHYDGRFFHSSVPYDEHRFVLRDLIRSYLTTMNKAGAETWIAHGTLLGWWWNGRIMPWDYDLDVQVNNNTMTWLGDNMNQTENVYAYVDDDKQKVEKKYLLDINPHHSEMDRGDGMNIIDARWIDMQNGMFIDITGVREREPDRPGAWSCKNKHRYNSQDLWPMRVTEFEGVSARIPYNFEQILSDEYGAKALVSEQHEGHKWRRDIKEWVKMTPEEEESAKKEAEAVARRKKEKADKEKAEREKKEKEKQEKEKLEKEKEEKEKEEKERLEKEQQEKEEQEKHQNSGSEAQHTGDDATQQQTQDGTDGKGQS